MPTPIGSRPVALPNLSAPEAASGPEAPAVPAMTRPAPVCEEPELAPRVETSAGALAASTMRPT
jgi:hypothetical protein